MAKILVVESDLEIFKMICRILGDAHEYRHFSSSKDVLKHMKQNKYDLCISNQDFETSIITINNSQMNGLELCSQIIRERILLPRQILLIGESRINSRYNTLYQASFVQIPFKVKELRSVISKILSRPPARYSRHY